MTREARIVCRALSAVCVAWTCSVPLFYVVTGDAESIVQLTRSVLDAGEILMPRVVIGLAVLVMLFVGVPSGLIFTLRVTWTRLRTPVWRGAIAGLFYGMWSNAVFLTVPYLGAYPSLPGLGLAMLVRRNGDDQHIPLLASNILVGLFFGILLALMHAQATRGRN